MEMSIEEMRDLRLQLKIPLRIVAKKTGFSETSISIYEKKKREAPRDFLLAYEYFLRSIQPAQPKRKQRISLRELFKEN